jgi:AbrB family looped-hinge helix DNA binding protein
MATKAVRVRVGGKRQITLPAAATEQLGLAKGDELEARILEDRIELVPLVAVPKEQAWFWTPDWQKKEREAEAARAAGDYTEHETIDDLIAGLKK